MKSNPPKFYWKKCYQIGNRTHWALCDTETDSDGPPHRVSALEMVLLDSTSRNLDKQDLPTLIVELLNKHYGGK